MEKLKALKTNKGIQYLLNEAYEILGNPIMTHNMEYKVIAYTENIVTDDPIWNEFVTTGTVNYERLEFYKNEEFIDTVANAEKITLLFSDKLKYKRILGKLFNYDNIQVGCASINESCQPFAEDDLMLYELFCDILNKEIAKSGYFRNYGQEYQEFLINKLIDGSIDDKRLYTAHVESIYINLKNNLYIIVADISKCDQLKYFRELFKRAEPTFKYSIYMNYIVIIMSSDNEAINVRTDLNKLNRLFKQNNIYAGVSSHFDNLFELQNYYVEALNALSNGLKKGINQQIFLNNGSS